MTGPLRYEHLQDPMGRDGTGTCIHTFAREINQIVGQYTIHGWYGTGNYFTTIDHFNLHLD